MEALFILLSCVLTVSVAQQVTIDPVGAVAVMEGNNLTITCTDGTNPGSTMRLRDQTGMELTGNSVPPDTVSGVMRTFALPVDRTMNDAMYSCISATTLSVSGEITLTVHWNDPILLSPSTDSVLDGAVTVAITLNANPSPTITMDRVDGMPILDENTRVIIRATSIFFQSLNGSDATNYTVRATNVAGVQMAIFSLSSGSSGCPTLLAVLAGIILAATNSLVPVL